MADYANFQLKNYIPDKGIDKKLLPENSDSSNLHDVPVLDDFEKLLLVSKMAISTLQGIQGCSKPFYCGSDTSATLI